MSKNVSMTVIFRELNPNRQHTLHPNMKDAMADLRALFPQTSKKFPKDKKFLEDLRGADVVVRLVES